MLFLGLGLEEWTAITNVLITVGLLAFAGMQWWVTNQAEQATLRERAAAELVRTEKNAADADLAFHTVWAEHFRLEALADYWEENDLVLLAALDVLKPEELLPSNWSALVAALARIGPEAAFLGGVAITACHDIGREVATLNGIVSSFVKQYPQLSPPEIVSMVRKNRGDDVKPIEQKVTSRAKDLAALMWDAARQSERADLTRSLYFKEDLVSKFARDASNALKRREEAGKALNAAVENA